MTIERLDTIECIIRELGSFSTFRMFGHLFNLRHGLETQLKSVEEICTNILDIQLRQMLIPGTSMPSTHLTLQSAKLEQALAACFSTHSPFWEQFYARQQASGSDDGNFNGLHLADKDVQSVARNSFPCFYTIIDALHFGASHSDHVYTLIQLSLQSYLKGMLLTVTNPEEANPAFAQAIKLLGPVNAPLYRELVIQKLAP